MVEMAPSGSWYSTQVNDGTILNPEVPPVADGTARVALAVNVFDVLAGITKDKPVKKYPPVKPLVLMLLKLWAVPTCVVPSQSLTLEITSSALSDAVEATSGSSFNSVIVYV